jgi:hypothetical protein
VKFDLIAEKTAVLLPQKEVEVSIVKESADFVTKVPDFGDDPPLKTIVEIMSVSQKQGGKVWHPKNEKKNEQQGLKEYKAR